MRTLTTLFGLVLALLIGFSVGYEYSKSYKLFGTSGIYIPKGYTIIEAGVAVDYKGDTVSVDGFRGISRNSESPANNKTP